MTAADSGTRTGAVVPLPGRPLVLSRMLRDRRRSVLWWAVSLALLALLFAAAFPSAKQSAEDLGAYMESLPQGVVELLGAGAGIGTAVGYLNSQFYANVFPLLLTILGIGVGAWAVAGSEGDGTLEMLLANPVRRGRVAAERFAGLVVVTGAVALAGTLALEAVASVFELREGVPAFGLETAGLGAWMLALAFSAISFGVGAATGSRGAAIAAGSAAAAGTYVLYGVSGFVSALEPLHWLSPWYWYLDSGALAEGSTVRFWLQAVALPLAVALVAAVAGVARFLRRDVG